MLFATAFLSLVAARLLPASGTLVRITFLFGWGGLLPLCFWLDTVRLSFVAVLSFVASTCHGLRSSYVFQASARRLYFFFYSLFYLSMLGLILSGDLLTAFLFWDGLGITSFFLVALFNNSISRGGAMLTLLTNRLGDMLLLVGAACYWGAGRMAWVMDWGGASLVASVFVCLGLFAKRAQWPMAGWLPAAMSAPTPVSALVHSSTLVTAGIYLLIRWGGLAPTNQILVGLRVATFIWGAARALLSFDIKRIIAMSTLSHLGVMGVALFSGQPGLGFYHLLVHALFKSNRFLCAGILIQAYKHTQDIRFMGGGGNRPVAKFRLVLCLWSLMGLPSALSFLSKGSSVLGGSVRPLLSIAMGGGLIMRSAYSVRLGVYLFNGGSICPQAQTSIGIELPTILSAGGGLILSLYLAFVFLSAPRVILWGWELTFLLAGGGAATIWALCDSKLGKGDWGGVYHIGRVLGAHKSASARGLLLMPRVWEHQHAEVARTGTKKISKIALKLTRLR